MSERLLVTGGSGFIGTEVVALALAKGLAVRNLDVAEPREPSHKSLWRRLDIRDGDGLRREIAAFDPHRILHLASDIDVSLPSLDRFTTTIAGTANLLAIAKDLPGLRRFVHISTQFVVTPGVLPQGERHYQPYTPYGAAKAEIERLVWRAGLSVPWHILRPTIIWGPHHPSFAREIFRHMRAGRYLHPASRVPILRSYGYVTNTAEQMLGFALLPPDATQDRVFYLGDENLDYARWADAFSMGLTGRPARRVPVPALRLLGRAGDVAKSLGLPSPIDSGRAFRMTTPSRIDLAPTLALVGPPRIGFENGVRKTLAWLEEVYQPMASVAAQKASATTE